MAILRKRHKTNFTTIDNELFRSCLSLKARGLLCTMLSLPEDWHFTERGLSSILPKDGRDSVRTTIKELETAGFLTRERVRDDKGKVVEWVWTFYDYQRLGYPGLENPTLDNPTLDNPTAYINNKESIKPDIKASQPAVASLPEQQDELGGTLSGLAEMEESRIGDEVKEAPGLDEVAAFFEAEGISVDPYRFWGVNETRGWCSGDGRPIDDWRRLAKSWAAHERTNTTRAPMQVPARRVPSVEEIMKEHYCDRETAEYMIEQKLY